jgi:hypothetical protein
LGTNKRENLPTCEKNPPNPPYFKGNKKKLKSLVFPVPCLSPVTFVGVSKKKKKKILSG